jgi:hypothetical protein
VALRGLVSAGLLAAAACAGVVTSTPQPAGPDLPIRIEARRTPLGIGGASLAPSVRYAGGLTLRGSHLHGLSDIKVEGDRAWIVSDFGDLVRFTLRFDQDGRLVSADQATRRALSDPDGAVLAPKDRADAEGLALLLDGRVLVAFEGEHRIWDYGVGGLGRPGSVAAPEVALASNEGFEGLAVAPDGWLVLAEGGGGWRCRAQGCSELSDLRPADGYRLTGVDRDPAGRGWYVVERYYSPPFDMRARVRFLSDDGRRSSPLIELRPPASVDNFEGVAAVATATGTRLYLLSDDNAKSLQKTLLLAFDVVPVS